MNLYTTHPSAIVCAITIDDRLGDEMIRSVSQLLSTVIWKIDPGRAEKLDIYRPFVQETPHVEWCAATRHNFGWGAKYVQTLLKQRKNPRSRASVAFGDISTWFLKTGLFRLGSGATPFPNNAVYKKLDFRGVQDTHVAYQQLLNARWEDYEPTWNYGQEPDWRENGKAV